MAAKIRNYWANFTLTQQINVIDLIEDIAWQLRCSLTYGDGEVSIKYLSEIPATVLDTDESEVENRSLQVSSTGIGDITTKLIAIWREDYSGRKPDKQYIYKAADSLIDKFGNREVSREFFIYNIYQWRPRI